MGGAGLLMDIMGLNDRLVMFISININGRYILFALKFPLNSWGPVQKRKMNLSPVMECMLGSSLHPSSIGFTTLLRLPQNRCRRMLLVRQAV